MIRVIIEWQLENEGSKDKLMGLLRDLRVSAMHQVGFVTSETLLNAEDKKEVIVVSTWRSPEYWKAWETAEPRIAITEMIYPLVAREPKFKICEIASMAD